MSPSLPGPGGPVPSMGHGPIRVLSPQESFDRLESVVTFPDPVMGETPQEYCKRIIRALYRERNNGFAPTRWALQVCIQTYRQTWGAK